MTASEKLKKALEIFGIPIGNGSYFGNATEYFVYLYNTFPVLHADDSPHAERYLTQLHYFCPHDVDSTALRQKIKRQLFAAGWTWPDEVNASDEIGQHYVYECELIGGMDGET